MRTQKLTILLAILLFCWGQVLAKYELIVTKPPSAANACDGSLLLIAHGNAGPYTFEWTNANGNVISQNVVTNAESTTSKLTGTCLQKYIVNVTNGFGCKTTLESATDLISVDVEVYLEGAYNKDIGEMTTGLCKLGLLPGQNPAAADLAVPTISGQPYSTEPFDYYGIEGDNWKDLHYEAIEDVVDWVLVSVRNGITEDTEIEKKAGLLKKDGSVVFLKPFQLLSTLTGNEGYIVVEHRNHLPIMSKEKVKINTANAMKYDFTKTDTYKSNASKVGQKQILSGIWSMYGRNADQKGIERFQFNGADKTEWTLQNGVPNIYSSSDMNLDADNTGADKAIWSINNGIACTPIFKITD